MFRIDIRYASDNWQEHLWQTNRPTKVDAFIVAHGAVVTAMQGKDFTYLPCGNWEFVIWQQGGCVGFVGIYETE